MTVNLRDYSASQTERQVNAFIMSSSLPTHPPCHGAYAPLKARRGLRLGTLAYQLTGLTPRPTRLQSDGKYTKIFSCNIYTHIFFNKNNRHFVVSIAEMRLEDQSTGMVHQIQSHGMWLTVIYIIRCSHPAR